MNLTLALRIVLELGLLILQIFLTLIILSVVIPFVIVKVIFEETYVYVKIGLNNLKYTDFVRRFNVKKFDK